jgi:hypothetical protein
MLRIKKQDTRLTLHVHRDDDDDDEEEEEVKRVTNYTHQSVCAKCSPLCWQHCTVPSSAWSFYTNQMGRETILFSNPHDMLLLHMPSSEESDPVCWSNVYLFNNGQRSKSREQITKSAHTRKIYMGSVYPYNRAVRSDSLAMQGRY